MALFTDDWCRIEGMAIPDLKKEYGPFSQLPDSTRIYYGAPEVQIFNKFSLVNGIVYKVVTLKSLGYNDIKDIDARYNDLLNDISSYDKTVDISDNVNSAQYYYTPFIIDENSVIFYADSTKTQFDHYAIVYVDKYATPEIISVTGQYIGNPVPVGDAFNVKDLQLFVIYADGNKALLHEGYDIDPEDRIITHLNSNIFTIIYTSPTGTEFRTQIAIQGVRKLTDVEAMYDGPSLTDGNEVQRRHLVVVATYSDGSSSTVTSYSFPNGNVVSNTNGGVIVLYYQGFYVRVVIPMYAVSSSRLIAYYNGPNVEVGNDFDIKYCNIRIFYQSNDAVNSHCETINPELCTISPRTIDHEGVNQITVQYTGKAGPVTTKMIVIGIKPEVVLNFIEAEYTGPEIYVGKSYSPERVIVKAHFSDGSIVTINNGFVLESNVVKYVGLNEFAVYYTYKDNKRATTIVVTGLEPDSTTGSGYKPITLDNHYPEATRLNNRYRGPAEAYKHNSINKMIFENIKELYDIFGDIEHTYNQYIDSVNGSNSIKVQSLNDIVKMEKTSRELLNDKRFTTGKYVKEEDNE